MGVTGEMAREEEGEGVRIQVSGVSSGCSAWCRSGTGATISGYEFLCSRGLAFLFVDGLSPLGTIR